MQLARTIADAAMACVGNGVGLSIAVVDRAGQIKVLFRGDGSPPMGAGSPPQGLHGANLPPAVAGMGQAHRDRSRRSAMLADVIPLGGGVPIKAGDEVIGEDRSERHARWPAGRRGLRQAAIAKVADQLEIAMQQVFGGWSFPAASASGTAGFMASTIEVGIRIVAPRSLVVS